MSQPTIPSGGSLVVSIAFKNEVGTAVVPSLVTWTLTDGSGNVINEREEVVVTPASTIKIVLRAADNPALDDSRRLITIRALYTSSLVPSEQMELVAQEEYYVNNIVEVAA